MLACALAGSAAGASAGSETPAEAGADEDAGGVVASDDMADDEPNAVASELRTKD